MCNPCKKTGGWIRLPGPEYVYGDIFETAPGALYVRVIKDIPSNYREDFPPGCDLWADMTHQTHSHVDGRIEQIHGTGRMLRQYNITADGVEEVEL